MYMIYLQAYIPHVNLATIQVAAGSFNPPSRMSWQMDWPVTCPFAPSLRHTAASWIGRSLNKNTTFCRTCTSEVQIVWYKFMTQTSWNIMRIFTMWLSIHLYSSLFYFTATVIQDVLDWISPPPWRIAFLFTASDALELHRLGRQVHVEEGVWWKGEE